MTRTLVSVIIPEKAKLRRTIARLRQEMPAITRDAANDALQEHLAAAVSHLQPRTVAAYAPFGNEYSAPEPGGSELPSLLIEIVTNVLLPTLRGPQMEWRVYTGKLHKHGRFYEPEGVRASLTQAEMIVVPALAVDLTGTRLGRGAGHYDRALHELRISNGPKVPVVALLYDDEIWDRLPREEHDEPVSAVITPSEGWRWLRKQ